MAFIKVAIDDTIHQYEYEESIQGEVVYDINTKEVGILKPEQQEIFKQEVEWMDAFTPYIACLSKEEQDEEKEADRKYMALATLIVLDEFNNAVDDVAKSEDIINNIEKKITGKKEELKSKGAIDTKAANLSSKVHSEVLWAKGQRMVRVRSERIRNHNRWFNRNQVQQQISADNQRSNDEAKKVAKSAEIKLLEKKFWSKDGALNDKFEEINKNLNAKFFEDSDVINSSIEAKLLRYTTEASAGAQLDWTNKKELKVGAKASGSFSVAEAKGDINVELPNQHGFGLMQYTKDIVPNAVDDDYTELFFKLVLGINGNAFVGVCASVSAELGLSATEGEKKAATTAELDLFAGAKAGASASVEMQMMFVEDEKMDKVREEVQTVGERGDKQISAKQIAERGLGKWEKLGGMEVGGFVAAGVGISAVFAVGYFEGRLRYQAKFALVLKVGGGKFMKGFVEVPQVAKFILTIAHNLNWKNISDAFDEQTQLLYHTVMNNCFYLKRTVNEVFGKIEDKFEEVMEFITDLDGFTGAGLESLKIVDDKLDELIPGYTSYKQYNKAFIILKDAYRKFKELQAKNKAIAIVLEAKGDDERWNYATWQLKVNLIYDMRKGRTDLIDDFNNKERGDAVLTVLDSARHAQEFDKIIRELKTPEGTLREPVFIEDLITEDQNNKYLEIITKKKAK